MTAAKSRAKLSKVKSQSLRRNPKRGVGFEWRERYMKPTRESKKAPAAESIARMADQGKDVSRFFTNRGKIMRPIQRVNVDFTASMLQELDQAAAELNVSRQAVIKALVRQSLDRHHLAQHARKAG